nr:hypothetical protein [Xanthomonas campestris]
MLEIAPLPYAHVFGHAIAIVARHCKRIVSGSNEAIDAKSGQDGKHVGWFKVEPLAATSPNLQVFVDLPLHADVVVGADPAEQQQLAMIAGL